MTEDHIVGKDRQGNELTHSALAERLMQVEAYRIQQSITEDNDYTVLAGLLETGLEAITNFQQENCGQNGQTQKTSGSDCWKIKNYLGVSTMMILR